MASTIGAVVIAFEPVHQRMAFTKLYHWDWQNAKNLTLYCILFEHRRQSFDII